MASWHRVKRTSSSLPHFATTASLCRVFQKLGESIVMLRQTLQRIRSILRSRRSVRREMARSVNRHQGITDQEDFWNVDTCRPKVRSAVFEPWDDSLKSERHKIRLTIRSQHQKRWHPRSIDEALGASHNIQALEARVVARLKSPARAAGDPGSQTPAP